MLTVLRGLAVSQSHRVDAAPRPAAVVLVPAVSHAPPSLAAPLPHDAARLCAVSSRRPRAHAAAAPALQQPASLSPDTQQHTHSGLWHTRTTDRFAHNQNTLRQASNRLGLMT